MLHRYLLLLLLTLSASLAFADQPLTRPHAGNVVTPPGRSAGNGYRSDLGAFQTLHRHENICRQTSVQGQCVINVCQNKANTLFLV